MSALKNSWLRKFSSPLRVVKGHVSQAKRSIEMHIREVHGFVIKHWLRAVLTFNKGALPRIENSLSALEKPNDRFVAPLPAAARTLYIFVDHTVRCEVNTGVQRVVRGVASGLATAGERVRYVKWNSDLKQCVLINLAERESLGKWNGPKVSPAERADYSTQADLRKVIEQHAPTANNWLIVPEVPYLTGERPEITMDLIDWAHRSGLKTGFIFYDAIPLRRKEWKNAGDRHRIYMQQLRLADVVWPISDWSSRDLITYWAFSEYATGRTIAEVATLALPGASGIAPRVLELLEGDRLILSVGTIEARKNQIALVRAFQAYRKLNPHSPWQLTLVGNLHPDMEPELSGATREDPSIRFLGTVSDAELDILYRRAAFTVFPSLEEGFGLPILESLWYAKPCLCANFGAMSEVAEGGGCLAIDITDESIFVAALGSLITDPTLRHKLSLEAVTRPISSWSDYANSLIARVDREAKPGKALGLIYYWVDSTISFYKNTGIQRVNCQLARTLMDMGISLVPVKWDKSSGSFATPDASELAYLAKWNGPKLEQWQTWKDPHEQANSWFLMSEPPLDLSTDEQLRVLSKVKKFGLKSAAVFYDAIPWKLKQYYPQHYSCAHGEYMTVLGNYDFILPISDLSRNDLIAFLGGAQSRPRNLDGFIKTALLPGEFPETPRIKDVEKVKTNGALTILCVGTVEPRKNHLALIEAFIIACRNSKQELKIVISGRKDAPDLTAKVVTMVLEHPSITWESDADDARLRELYGQCDFTVFPSLEEGFGLPILESLWFGKPCICANFGAMAEVAQEGGCLTVDVRDPQALAGAILKLCDEESRQILAKQAVSMPFKSWRDYALEVSLRLARFAPAPPSSELPLARPEILAKARAMGLIPRTKLSVCISTYNRAGWLAKSLENWAAQHPQPMSGVQIFVCDNASTDNTSEIAARYLSRPDFSYRCNPVNVGMLGNLRETAHHATGEYIWILGDDDLLLPGTIERVIRALNENPDIALVYLNYAYTRIEDARTIGDFNAFFDSAIPIVPPESDLFGPIRTICARNENFFTAIYTLVLRRDHAIGAYSQDTSGRPFSTMLTAIPTTHYVLENMMDEPGVWLGTPQLVVNMNVSWLKYAPLWILERIPEVYEMAELKGVAAADMDRWRRHTLPGVLHFFSEIYQSDPLDNALYFDPARLVRRFKHLPEFKEIESKMRNVYDKARSVGHRAAKTPTAIVFPPRHANLERGIL